MSYKPRHPTKFQASTDASVAIATNREGLRSPHQRAGLSHRSGGAVPVDEAATLAQEAVNSQAKWSQKQ